MGLEKKIKSKKDESIDRKKSITTTKFSKRLLGRQNKQSK